jgi:hypothetical protein
MERKGGERGRRENETRKRGRKRVVGNEMT